MHALPADPQISFRKPKVKFANVGDEANVEDFRKEEEEQTTTVSPVEGN